MSAPSGAGADLAPELLREPRGDGLGLPTPVVGHRGEPADARIAPPAHARRGQRDGGLAAVEQALGRCTRLDVAVRRAVLGAEDDQIGAEVGGEHREPLRGGGAEHDVALGLGRSQQGGAGMEQARGLLALHHLTALHGLGGVADVGE